MEFQNKYVLNPVNIFNLEIHNVTKETRNKSSGNFQSYFDKEVVNKKNDEPIKEDKFKKDDKINKNEKHSENNLKRNDNFRKKIQNNDKREVNDNSIVVKKDDFNNLKDKSSIQDEVVDKKDEIVNKLIDSKIDSIDDLVNVLSQIMGVDSKELKDILNTLNNVESEKSDEGESQNVENLINNIQELIGIMNKFGEKLKELDMNLNSKEPINVKNIESNEKEVTSELNNVKSTDFLIEDKKQEITKFVDKIKTKLESLVKESTLMEQLSNKGNFNLTKLNELNTNLKDLQKIIEQEVEPIIENIDDLNIENKIFESVKKEDGILNSEQFKKEDSKDNKEIYNSPVNYENTEEDTQQNKDYKNSTNDEQTTQNKEFSFNKDTKLNDLENKIDVKIDDKIENKLEDKLENKSEIKIENTQLESKNNNFNKDVVNDIKSNKTLHQNVKVDKHEIINQVLDKAKLNINGDKTEMLISLKPENLGKLQLKIVSENGMIMAKIVAENQQVKEIIETNMNILKDSLMKQGVMIEGLSVSVNDNGNQRQDSSEDRGFRDTENRYSNLYSENITGIEISKSNKVDKYTSIGSSINLTA